VCEFCTRHGEGGRWYDNIANYTEEVFHQVNSRENLKAFLGSLRRSMEVGPPRAHKWKRRLPRIYDLIAHPLLTRRLKKTHFGQILPVEDAEKILEGVGSIVRLPCVCRKVTTGEDRRYCLGIGMDLTTIFKDTPDFGEFERLTREEATGFVRALDIEGKTHSVWTFNTPFIGALCNCDRDCMAYRSEVRMGICRAMWKGEYVARMDPLACTGCRECMKRCYFGAVGYDRAGGKCTVDVMKCYGCGICRAVCDSGAIDLIERSGVPLAAGEW
jgi:ferredoxin